MILEGTLAELDEAAARRVVDWDNQPVGVEPQVLAELVRGYRFAMRTVLEVGTDDDDVPADGPATDEPSGDSGDGGPAPVVAGTFKYQRIAADLRAAMADGTYRPGEQVPGENEIMAAYGVARMTARQALGVLRDEGLTVTHPGKGVFVRRGDAPPTPTGTPGILAGEAARALEALAVTHLEDAWAVLPPVVRARAGHRAGYTVWLTLADGREVFAGSVFHRDLTRLMCLGFNQLVMLGADVTDLVAWAGRELSSPPG